jgi:hypothetical protein
MANFSTRLMKAVKNEPTGRERRRCLLSPLPPYVACETPNLRSTEMELDQRKAPRYLGDVLGPLLWWNGTFHIPPVGPRCVISVKSKLRESGFLPALRKFVWEKALSVDAVASTEKTCREIFEAFFNDFGADSLVVSRGV